MKMPNHRRKRWSMAMVLMAVLLFGFVGIALGSTETAETAEGGHGEAHEGAHGSKGWVATDTYRVMNFAVLAAALFFVLRKPLSQNLNARIRGIKDQLSDLEGQKKAAEKELAAYTAKLAGLEKEAEGLMNEYVRQGNEARERIIQEAESAAEKLEAQAKRNIEHEFKTAKARLQEDILDKALVKAEAILKQKITADDQERLVDEYLEKVVA